jgi:hypothetical protein
MLWGCGGHVYMTYTPPPPNDNIRTTTTTVVGRGGTNPAATLACEPMWLMRFWLSPVVLIRFVGDQKSFKPGVSSSSCF